MRTLPDRAAMPTPCLDSSFDAVAADEAWPRSRRRNVVLFDEPARMATPAAAPAERRLPSILDELVHARDAQERRQRVAAIVHAMGFDWLGYGRVQAISHAVLPIAFCTAHGDLAWQRRYVAEGYYQVDPRLQQALRSNLPVVWRLDELASQAAQAADPKLWRFVHDLGHTTMRSGVMLALASPEPHQRTLISLLSRQGAVQRDDEDGLLGEVLTLGVCLHEYYTHYAPPLDDAAVPASADALSQTQRAILQCLGRGLADKQIADCLSLSPHTVDYHMRQLRKRFGARNRMQLLRSAAG